MTDNDKKDGENTEIDRDKLERTDRSKLTKQQLTELMLQEGDSFEVREAVRRQKAAQKKDSEDKSR